MRLELDLKQVETLLYLVDRGIEAEIKRIRAQAFQEFVSITSEDREFARQAGIKLS